MDRNANNCPLPPTGFTQDDLLGTWVAGGPRKNDTLIIRQDGTYKQIVHYDPATGPDLDYESDWQPWWLEYSDTGIPYLHLDGMSICGWNPEIDCDRPGGGGYDLCADRSLPQTNAVILIVLGVPDYVDQNDPKAYPPRGILLEMPLGSENSWEYHLESP